MRIDRLDGRWALTRAPWRLSIAYLRAGTVDVRIVPGPPEAVDAAADLRVPLQLRIDDLRVDHLAIHRAHRRPSSSTTALNGRSDGRHHELALDGVDTLYGALTARAKLDGVKPSALTGTATYAGKLSDEPVNASANVSGLLEALVAEVSASGMKLNWAGARTSRPRRSARCRSRARRWRSIT